MATSKTLTRRELNKLLLSVTAATAVAGLSGVTVHAQDPLRIGIIGSGQIGGAIGKRWAEAGHQIFFSSRNPGELAPLVAEAGPNAQAGTVAEAAQFGDIVLVAVPYGAMPQVGADNSQYLGGKIVIDCGNPRADRDGPMADEAIAKGTGVASAEFFPGTRLVRAFNAVSAAMVENQHHREGEWIGIPLAGDDAEAVAITERLVLDAGFDPVFVGPLSSARRFDRGTNVYVRGMTASELRRVLNL